MQTLSKRKKKKKRVILVGSFCDVTKGTGACPVCSRMCSAGPFTLKKRLCFCATSASVTISGSIERNSFQKKKKNGAETIGNEGEITIQNRRHKSSRSV